MSLIKTKQRVADHGEMFTPAWMVEATLDLVKGETELFTPTQPTYPSMTVSALAAAPGAAEASLANRRAAP